MVKATARLRLIVVLALLGGVVSLLNLLPFIHRSVDPLQDPFLPIGSRRAFHVVSALLGFALLYLGYGLWRRKHRAWQLALVLYAFTIVVHLLKGPHWIPMLYGVVMVVLLIWAKDEFFAKPDPASLFALLWFIPTYVVVVVAYTAVALGFEHDKIEKSLSLWGVIQSAFLGLVGIDGPYTYQSRLFADTFPPSLVGLGIAGVAIFLLLLLRPIMQTPEPSKDEWEHANRLVHQYGWDTLAYFTLRPDKSYFFSSDGEAMVSYTYLARTALVSADPIGAPASIPVVLDEFLQFCQERAWTIGFLSVREADKEMYTERGLHTLYLGDEAIIHCDTFTLNGKKMKGVRQAVNRVAKSYRYSLIKETEASPELVGKLNAISEKWRGKNPERGFTMALSGDVTGDNEEFVLGVALDENDEPGGFLRFVPAYGDDFGYTMDLMRHDPDAPNGMTEYLTANTALALHERDVVRMSLNFAAWRRFWDEAVELSRGERIAKWFAGKLNPFFQIRSLYDFNKKFLPEWLPRMIVYEEGTSLARVGILYQGLEGFLNIPVLGKYFVPRMVRQEGKAGFVGMAAAADRG